MPCPKGIRVAGLRDLEPICQVESQVAQKPFTRAAGWQGAAPLFAGAVLEFPDPERDE